MKIAQQEYFIVQNPTEGVTVPKPNYKQKRILSDAQLETFMDAIRKDEVW